LGDKCRTKQTPNENRHIKMDSSAYSTKRARSNDEACECYVMANDARSVATEALIELKKMREDRDEARVRWDEESAYRAKARAEAIRACAEAKGACTEAKGQ